MAGSGDSIAYRESRTLSGWHGAGAVGECYMLSSYLEISTTRRVSEEGVEMERLDCPKLLPR